MNTSPAPHVNKTANVAKSAKIWAGAQVRENAVIGERSTIGQYCYVGPGVQIGDDCAVQNHALIYEPAKIRNGVFIGPGVIITNDINPRAINQNFQRKGPDEWLAQAATIECGASLGARVVCVGGVNLGKFCMVGAGSVVVNDVLQFELHVGVPARRIGWVGRAGLRLVEFDSHLLCPLSGEKYFFDADGVLQFDEMH